MPSELGITQEVAVKLLSLREALAHDNVAEAWHWLHKIANPEVESFAPWDTLEALAADQSPAPVEEPAEPENEPTAVDPKAAAALISFLTRPIPEENVLRAEDDEEEAAPPEVLVSREEAAKVVCEGCRIYGPPVPGKERGKLWHPFGSRVGWHECVAAAIRAMPPYGEKEKK